MLPSVELVPIDRRGFQMFVTYEYFPLNHFATPHHCWQVVQIE